MIPQGMDDCPEDRDQSRSDRQIILALKALDHRRTRLKVEIATTSKHWNAQIAEASKALNEAIRQPEPERDQECRWRVQAIQQHDENKRGLTNDKAKALDALKKTLADVEATFIEVLRMDGDGDQLNMNFAGDASGFDRNAGILLNSVQTGHVRDAISAYADDSEVEVAGMSDLVGRLDELGVVGLGFPAEMEEEEAAGGE